MQLCRTCQGITPACAGKRLFNPAQYIVSWDHPRLRGEKQLEAAHKPPERGSPPLARGKEWRTMGLLSSSRITPACAGKRRLVAATRLPGQDHPRLRGEKTIFATRPYSRKGSPPLARGKVVTRRSASLVPGITPACAGKSYNLDPDAASNRDHPRLRGEKKRLRCLF